jgi:uncharacterized protein with NRDE domain
VVDALTAGDSLRSWAESAADRAEEYGGYNLIVGDGRALHFLSNRGPSRFDLAAGVYGLSNHRLDTPWPKVVAVREKLRVLVDRPRLDAESLFDIVADRRPAPDELLPHTGVPLDWERALSAAFIVGAEYGTRASTVVLRGRDGRIELVERRFAPDGAVSWESRFEVSP